MEIERVRGILTGVILFTVIFFAGTYAGKVTERSRAADEVALQKKIKMDAWKLRLYVTNVATTVMRKEGCTKIDINKVIDITAGLVKGEELK